MSRPRIESPYLAPRRLIPRDFQEARVGDTDMGASDVARLVLHRITKSRYGKRAHVLVDLDGGVYVAMRPSPNLHELIQTHPSLLVGVYTKAAKLDDVAGDIEWHSKEMSP